jgi:hypothetical protein
LVSLSVRAVELPLRWHFSHPAPHGNNIVDMAFLPSSGGSAGLWVQVAERGQIYTSSDLDLWIPRRSNTTNALRAVTFFGSRVIITGENGTVLYADSLDQFLPGTLATGSTSDWLEAVTASLNLTVAVGDRGAIYASNNGVTWRRQSNTGIANLTNDLRGVAWGNGVFVAVGTAGFIATSSNGTNWAKRSNTVRTNLNRVSFAAGRWTAVGDSGVVLTSLNATNWAREYSGATNSLQHATTAPANGARLLIGDYEVRVNEGASWIDELVKADGPPAWKYFANVARSNFFLIAGRTGMMAEGYKTNGSSYFWLPSFESTRHLLWDVTYASNLYVTVGDFGTVMSSGDGVNWNLEFVPDSFTNTTLLGVGGTTNLLIATGDNGAMLLSPNTLTTITETNVIGSKVIITNYAVSSLGVLWYALEPRPTTNALQGVAFFNGLYVVVGEHGVILTSPNGTNWSPAITLTNKLLTSVVAWPDGLVASGDDGTLITSPDGKSWALHSINNTNWLYRVRYLDGKLFAVGQNGTIRVSTDGVNWSLRTSGTTEWLTDITQIGDTFFAVGYFGTVLTSADTVSWINQGTITEKDLMSVATDSRQLITVGYEGIILRSPVLPDLTPPSFLAYARIPSTNGQPAYNLFLFGGVPDQQFTLDYRSDFTTNRWQIGPQLEFLDSDGTLYYLETIPGINAPPLEFYRATLQP